MNLRIPLAIAVLFLVPLARADNPQGDAIAKKLGYDNWKGFLEQGYWSRADFSKLSASERDWMLQTARGFKQLELMDSGYGNSTPACVILLKLHDASTLDFFRKQFKRGYMWACGASECCKDANELFLISLAAETLFTDRPEKYIVQDSDVIFDAPPCEYSADAIQGILTNNLQLPEALRKDAQTESRQHSADVVHIYRRWWNANREAISKGDLTKVTSPKLFIPKAPSAKQSLTIIAKLPANASFSDVAKIADMPIMQFGSGSHYYDYGLDDGSMLRVETDSENKSLISIKQYPKNYSDESQIRLLFPKR